jgi:hypothetical protein
MVFGLSGSFRVGVYSIGGSDPDPRPSPIKAPPPRGIPRRQPALVRTTLASKSVNQPFVNRVVGFPPISPCRPLRPTAGPPVEVLPYRVLRGLCAHRGSVMAPQAPAARDSACARAHCGPALARVSGPHLCPSTQGKNRCGLQGALPRTVAQNSALGMPLCVSSRGHLPKTCSCPSTFLGATRPRTCTSECPGGRLEEPRGIFNRHPPGFHCTEPSHLSMQR